jgi:hypothetical protein
MSQNIKLHAILVCLKQPHTKDRRKRKKQTIKEMAEQKQRENMV